jgi:hypothetical protein
MLKIASIAAARNEPITIPIINQTAHMLSSILGETPIPSVTRDGQGWRPTRD